jgi:phosphatidylglycerophosphatase A
MKRRIVEIFATGFYFGKAPFMPGTFGTLWGIPLVWALSYLQPVTYMMACVAFLFFAIYIASTYEKNTAAHDPGEVVIDEIIGYAIAMTWLPFTWQSYLAAFVVFRFFDIVKPPPIRAIDRRVKGGFGTVLDDVVAGLAANVVLQIVYTQTNWLGAQLHG